MQAPAAPSASVRYTTLADRFRSLWTFHQFLSSVINHLGEGPIRYVYDFQGLHRRLQGMVHTVGVGGSSAAVPELDQIERELDRIHRELSRIELGYAPSVLRRFFDHINRQDQKVLCALIKFYLMFKHFEQDTLDKLDILCTRLAEAPGDGRVAAPREASELLRSFRSLGEFTDLPGLPAAEAAPLVEAVRSIRHEFESIDGADAEAASKVYERYRRLKQRLGTNVLQPQLMAEIVTANIVAKNRFRQLFEFEEQRVLGNSNRISEIERYLSRHPELADDELRRQLDDFRHFRIRYESGRRQENVKRDDITEMTRAMHAVLARFDSATNRPLRVPTGPVDAQPAAELHAASVGPDRVAQSDEPRGASAAAAEMGDGASVSKLLPPDPLISEPLHKIMFALELVVWDRLPGQVAQAPEIQRLGLDSWEIDSYRMLIDQTLEQGTAESELARFFLASAALRIKMDEEREEISRLEAAQNPDRLYELLEHSAQSLERARDVERRFQWFIDDMLFRGDTNKLENVYSSRFKFLHSYSGLWLAHQRSGGLTPL